MKNIIKLYKVPLCIAGIQWYATTIFQVDKFFFQYDIGLDSFLYRSIKVFYLLFLIAAWCFGFSVFRNYQKNCREYRRGIRVFLVYFIFSMTALLVLWPGTWAWDDIGMIQETLVYYQWDPWQHILTSIFQMVFLQILPFPGGIVLIQNALIAVCVAFCVVKLENSFHIGLLKYTWLDFLIKLMPFFLPPVLMYQFSGYRIGLYVYLELTMLCMLVSAFKEKKEWKIPDICIFCFLGAVTANWRTESFMYIPVLCMLIFQLKDVMTKKKRIITFFLLLFSFFGIWHVQSKALGSSNYEIISTLRPLTELIRVSDTQKDQEYLEAVDRVIDLDMVYENPQWNGEELYWSDVTRYGYTKEEYRKYLVAFMILSLKYPRTVVKERLTLFAASIGLCGQNQMVTNVDASAGLFEPVEPDTRAGVFQGIDWVANKPVFPKLRKSLIYFLGHRTADGREWITFRFIWNAFLPMMIFLASWLFMLARKKWEWFMLGIPVFLKILIIGFTQPGPWFMYFLFVYLIGYVVLVYGILYYFHRYSYTMQQKDDSYIV